MHTKNKHSHPRLWATTLVFLLLANCAWATALEKVTVQLKWSHQYQFAGYYMAKHLGYYSELGLDVTFIEGGPTVNVPNVVLSGAAQFGVGTSDLLLDYAHGKPVVALGVIYQHSPLALAMKTDAPAATLEQLIGKSIYIENHAADLIAMLKRQGLNPDDLDIQASYNQTDDAIATSCYITDEPYTLQQQGIGHLIFTPRSYGIDFYGDNFFTTQDILKNRKDVVDAFIEATIRGWSYAMSHPEESVDVILDTYATNKSREHLLFEAQVTQQLMTRLVTPGFMNPERWKHIAETYQEVDMLDTMPPLANFIYDPSHNSAKAHIQELFPYLSATTIILCLVLFYLRYKNLLLQKALSEEKALTLQQQATENERRLKLQHRIIRDIHDGLGGLINNMSMMSEIAMREPDEASRQCWLRKIGLAAEESGIEIHSLMNALEDSTMIWGQYIASLRRSVEALFSEPHWEIQFEISDVSDQQELNVVEGLSLTRMTRECLNNVVKHSGGSKVQICILFSKDTLKIQIIDNGHGFDPKTVRLGRGLGNLEKRAGEFNGTFDITSSPKGTNLSIHLPLPITLQQQL